MKTEIKKRICRLFFKKYHFQGLIQFDESNKLSVCGCSVKWLDKITIKDITMKRATKKAFKYFNEKYPEYYGWVQLF